MPLSTQEIAFYASQGVSFAEGLTPHLMSEAESAMWKSDFQMAMDAQPALVTVANAGIPAMLANIFDPNVIDIIVQPMRAVEIFGETKKGDWTTATAEFPVAEYTGEVSSYGDWNTNGSSGANFNWESRQSYLYQVISQWGELELEKFGLAKIDYKTRIDGGAARAMNKFHNKTYFYGVANLINYGILNDPSLAAPIAPATKVASGVTWAVATATEIYQDVLNLYKQLVTQMGQNIDEDTPMTLALSGTDAINLKKVSQYNVSARTTIEEAFKNLKIKTAPEYATQAGGLMQLIVDSYENEDTAYCAFNSKFRAHPVIPSLSGWQQKKSGGTWGWIMRRPIGVAQMLGIS